jgi:uncharacterized membrane protein YjdF
MALVVLAIVFFAYSWIEMTDLEFILFCIALLFHNLGTFGFYGISAGSFAYDNMVHIFSSFVAAWIFTNMLSRKLYKRKKDSINCFLFIALAVSLSMIFGTLVEMVEYGGYIFLGPGEGLFFTGKGDIDGQFRGNYQDTMEDIIFNFLGSVIGSIAYYQLKIKIPSGEKK